MEGAGAFEVQLLSGGLLFELTDLIWNVEIFMALNHRFLRIGVDGSKGVQWLRVGELTIEARVAAHKHLLSDLLYHRDRLT